MRILSRVVALSVLISACMAVGAPATVSADDCVSNFPWSSETELLSYEGSQANGCRRTFTTDPGVGELLDPNSTASPVGLLTPERVDFYVDRGFNENFLWYSPRTTTTTGPWDTRRWTGCGVDFPVGGICPLSELHANQMGEAFDTNVTLHIIGYPSAFIILACGNYYSTEGLDPPSPVPSPTPYFDGVKFRDNNRNGQRDAGEQLLSGWQIKITRLSSEIGQSTGVVGVETTDTNGAYRFDLSGHGPGRYRVEEIPRAGWKNSTPIAYEIDVDFGVESRRYTRDFGNAETVADVAKTSMTVLDVPTSIDVNAPTDVTVSVTVENLGPADQVPVRDEIVAVLPADCTTPDPRRSFTALLRRDLPITRTFTFSITCRAPSEHSFRFDDILSITHPDITDINEHNNEASTGFVAPVHAYTDLGVAAILVCAERTDVDIAADCDVDITVTNSGFGSAEVPVDATVAAQLALPADCTASPGLATLSYPGLADGDSVTQTQRFSVVCTHRSFHEIEVSVAVTAGDPHVFDTDETNNTAGDGPSIMEVFHDATMAATNVHLVCNEVLSAGPFTCTATVDYVKTGPAPLVDVDLSALLEGPDDCAITSPDHTQNFILGDTPGVRMFVWTIECDPSDVLHPFKVTTDIVPSVREPHAVDEPGPIMDRWVVPFCLPTVNPHGQQEPQAPGSGMNEDGFYIFGTLPGEEGEQVYIRDDASNVVFGPFDNGTRIKWVEGNGAEPTLTEMGGNNGYRKGQALAVDYQVIAQGDAQAFFVDEEGVEVSVTCLVPPFPK